MIDTARAPWAAAKFVAQNLNRNKFLSALTGHGGIVEAINERKALDLTMRLRKGDALPCVRWS
jgi:hypothetical protein